MTKEFLIYLAGPITGISYGESTDWRKEISKMFSENFLVISPMRGKTYLSKENLVKDSYENHPLSSQRGITLRDNMDVNRCDLLMVNLLGAKKVSIGSVLEIAWAYQLRKPIILLMEKDNPHNHAMIREVAWYITDDFEKAVWYAKALLSPGI